MEALAWRFPGDPWETPVLRSRVEPISATPGSELHRTNLLCPEDGLGELDRCPWHCVSAPAHVRTLSTLRGGGDDNEAKHSSGSTGSGRTCCIVGRPPTEPSPAYIPPVSRTCLPTFKLRVPEDAIAISAQRPAAIRCA
jgi:hypothetical protein